MKPTQSQVSTLYQNLQSRYSAGQLKILSDEAKKFASYLNTLSGFHVINAPASRGHIGEVIVDAVLQVGHDFEKQVRPAVQRIVKFGVAATVSGFINLLNTKPLNSLINFKRESTKNHLLMAATFFKGKDIESFNDLHEWLALEENRDSLLTKSSGLGEGVFKIGDKTADYFRLVVGHWDAVAVDRGVRQLLHEAAVISRYSTKYDYKEIRSIVQLTAVSHLNCRPLDLDTSIYKYYVSNKRSRNRALGRTKPIVLAGGNCKYCIHCGMSIPQRAIYCSKCGGRQT